MLWDIICMSVGSLIWGVLISILCTTIFALAITSWWKDAHFTVWSYLIGVILCLLLTVENTLIIGSLKIMDTIDEYEAYTTKIIDKVYKNYGKISVEESDTLIQEVINHFPLLGDYIGEVQLNGCNIDELPKALADEIRSFMREYIVRRLLWSLGFIFVAGTLIIWTLDKHNRYTRPMDDRRRNPTQRSSGRQRPTGSNPQRRPHISTHRK